MTFEARPPFGLKLQMADDSSISEFVREREVIQP
jgi:hypothetical protein